MNVKLNIKSIIKFELLTNKPFSKIDLTNESELLELLYCILLTNNDEVFTFNEFLEMVKSKKISKDLFEKFNKQLKVIDLFSKHQNQNKENIEDSIDDEKVIDDEKWIKDIATVLIINAKIDAKYVMNDLTIDEIPIFVDAYNQKVKNDLEEKRLFTYLTILPHIDGNKINSPQKFFMLPWEVDVDAIKEKNDLKNMVNELPEMFEQGKKIIEKLNKQK